MEPNVLANLTSTLGYHTNRIKIKFNFYVNLAVLNTKLITGNGRPAATLSASGVDAIGEANSERLFLLTLNPKGARLPGVGKDVLPVYYFC